MEITPEERQRIYEEEKARVEARSQIEADARRTQGRRIGKVIFNLSLLCVVVGFVFWAVSYFRYYDSITPESLDAQVAAQRDAQYQQAQASLRAAGIDPNNINGVPVTSSVPELDGLSQRFSVDDDYCIVDGEVKNISPNSMANVDATATFYDSNHNVVKTADALIKYNPILPGQTSPFEVITTSNPAIKTEVLTFAFLDGAEIPASHR